MGLFALSVFKNRLQILSYAQLVRGSYPATMKLYFPFVSKVILNLASHHCPPTVLGLMLPPFP